MGIPKLIHQSWRDAGFPKDLFNYRWQQGLVNLNPNWTLVKWTDESSRALIAQEYPWFLDTYDAYPSYIQRSDAARYFILYHHGGVYADLDIECSKPFGPVLGDHRAIFSYKVDSNMSRGIVNALFASEARHPLWRTVFELLVNRSHLGRSASTHVEVVRSTGPGLLREALMQLGFGGGGPREREAEAWLGVHLLEAAVWHPTLPEQKHGRDASAATRTAIARSHCHHHFVSSWMTHDKRTHGATDAKRSAGGASGAATVGSVPLGQGIRSVNPWRSFELKRESSREAAASDESEPPGANPPESLAQRRHHKASQAEREQRPRANWHAKRAGRGERAQKDGSSDRARGSFLQRGYARRMGARQRAEGQEA